MEELAHAYLSTFYRDPYKNFEINVDQVQSYHSRDRNAGDVETDRSTGEGLRATQGEAEGSEGLIREESTEVEQLRGKRRSVGSCSTISNRERQHHNENKVKRRLPEKQNIVKRRAPSSQQEDKEVNKPPHGSHKWRKKLAPQSLQSGSRIKKIPRRNSYQESGRSRVETSNAESCLKPEALPRSGIHRKTSPAQKVKSLLTSKYSGNHRKTSDTRKDKSLPNQKPSGNKKRKKHQRAGGAEIEAEQRKGYSHDGFKRGATLEQLDRRPSQRASS
ncbi:hypothetical protein TNIN_207251 [Trichonephila inaurata madagascariensis]|uniref:Uncharacterized protein n=1 Tax=Trichonephila inaurata madagascariensis TaxID=2747483 RepID=A0A8X6XKA4_9ARAC|nr:hypothetical protein TNIN_207251 [Trichonephila inaurata madagascariensis]